MSANPRASPIRRPLRIVRRDHLLLQRRLERVPQPPVILVRHPPAHLPRQLRTCWRRTPWPGAGGRTGAAHRIPPPAAASGGPLGAECSQRVTTLTGRDGAADALQARMAAGAAGRTVLLLTCMERGSVLGIPVGQQRLRTVAATESGGSPRGRGGRPARHRRAHMPWPCSLLAVVESHERSGGSGPSSAAIA